MFCVERRQVGELGDRLGKDAGRDFWDFLRVGRGACCLRLMGTVGVGGGGGRRGRGLSIGS